MSSATERNSQAMRARLASVGIVLDETRPAVVTQRDPMPANGVVDSDEVRAILRAAGAPERDLEWLVPSCPSIEAARAYRQPQRYAWCVACSEPMPVDERGCVPCRERGAP